MKLNSFQLKNFLGIYKIHVDLFKTGNMTTKSKNLTDRVDTTCVTDFIWNDNDGKVALKDAVVDDFAFTPGKEKIYTTLRISVKDSSSKQLIGVRLPYGKSFFEAKRAFLQEMSTTMLFRINLDINDSL